MSNSIPSNKIAVITGAGRGVGRVIALALADHGIHVCLVARNRGQLESVAGQIGEAGGNAHVFAIDASSAAAVESLRRDVETQVGTPGILINAAGVFGPIQLIQDSSPDEWIETLMINAVAPYLTSRAFMAGMVQAGWGRIVNVTSAAALHRPGPLSSAYATSKVALNQFTRHLAFELKGTGVTANVFHPGEVKTEMWNDIRTKVEKLGPEGDAYRQWVGMVDESGGDDPEKSANLVLKLLKPESGDISGQFLWIEAGLQKPITSWENDSA